MSDNYHTECLTRYKRARDNPENKSIADEIRSIEQEVKKMPLLSRAYFRTEERRQLDKYKSDIFTPMTLDYRLETHNCALENTLEFNKNPSWLKFLFHKKIWYRK